MIAQIGDHAEAGVIDQVGAEVIAKAFDDGRGDEREGHHRPRVVHVGMRNVALRSKCQAAARGGNSMRPLFRLCGLRTTSKMGTNSSMRKRVEQADHGQQQDAGQPLERVGQPVAQEAEESPHAGSSAYRVQGPEHVQKRLVRNSISVLYPAAQGLRRLLSRAFFDQPGGREALDERNNLDLAAPGEHLAGAHDGFDVRSRRP